MKKCSYCGKEYPDDALVCATDGQPLQPVTPPTPAPPFPVPQYPPQRKALTYIAPLRAGVVLAVMYGFLGLIFVPFFLIMTLIGKASGAPGPALFGSFLVVLFPIFYAIAGFIGGVVGAAIYNLIAKWTGGLEFEFRDAPPRPVY